MRTLLLISVAVGLAAMLPSCTAAITCNQTECKTSGGKYCFGIKCTRDGKNCTDLDEEIFDCVPRGDSCGEGQYCERGFKCAKDACRDDAGCDEKTNGTVCNDGKGRCSGGVCWVRCTKTCGDFPCIGGFCADIRCGESVCYYT